MLVVGLLMRIYLVLEIQPATDIYYYNTQAAQLILHGVDPYGHLFTGIPPQLETPGAEKVFTYLPFTAVYFVPFYLLGDIRFGIVAADIAIGLCLFQFSKKWSLLASAAFLLIPFSTYFMNDLVPAIAFVAASIALEYRGRRLLSGVALGFALATSVMVWLLVPFYVYRYSRNRDLRFLLVGLATFAGICAPFFAPSPGDFVYDVLLFQFARQATPLLTFGGTFGITLNASLSGLLIALTGQSAPLYLRAAAALSLLAACLFLRPPKTADPDGLKGEEPLLQSMLVRSSIFTATAIVILPSVLFFIYAELPLLLFLSWVALQEGPGLGRRRFD